MALTYIPVSGKPITTQRVTFSGRPYTLGLRFNTREGAWYLSLEDALGVLLAPRKVITGFPLLRLLKGPRRPAGEIIVIDRTGLGVDPGLADLGVSAVLMYATNA